MVIQHSTVDVAPFKMQPGREWMHPGSVDSRPGGGSGGEEAGLRQVLPGFSFVSGSRFSRRIPVVSLRWLLCHSCSMARPVLLQPDQAIPILPPGCGHACARPLRGLQPLHSGVYALPHQNHCHKPQRPALGPDGRLAPGLSISLRHLITPCGNRRPWGPQSDLPISRQLAALMREVASYV